MVDRNALLDDRTDFSRREELPEGEYIVRITETAYATQADRSKKREASIADGYDVGPNEPLGPMGTVTYQVLTGENGGGVISDYFWLKSATKGDDKRQYQKVQAVLKATKVLAEDKKLNMEQVEKGLEKAMTELKGKQLCITTKQDKNGRAEIATYAMSGSSAAPAAEADEIPF